ncbi:MAG: lamin tail domain-containing protein [Verrucomicrobia bacterium]|nr:lamin tail domain-containing protein [Verrucomicrobiota bacterium]
MRKIYKRVTAVALHLLSLCVLLGDGPVIMNEIHVDPDVKTEPAEFVELYNTSDSAIDISGWYFSDGISFTNPPGTVIPAHGFMVIAEDPDFLKQKFGADAIGPFEGSIENHGEELVLRDSTGDVADRLDYGLGFPWPTVGDPPGYSMELINPEFDNDLGGNWRSSVKGQVLTNPPNIIIPRNSDWKYFEGVEEASSPTDAWRDIEFDDTDWAVGAAPIGYGEDFIPTEIDMRYNFSSVYFRKEFALDDPSSIGTLVFNIIYDDGFKLWINGKYAIGRNVADSEMTFDDTSNSAIEDMSYNEYVVNNAAEYIVEGTNVIAVHGFNASVGGSSDFLVDVELIGEESVASSPDRGPTPGMTNSVFALTAPPRIRQVDHDPKSPKSNEQVVVTAKVTDPDGVSAVKLLYQVVEPGNYIELTDPAYATNWIEMPMNDDGTGGDDLAADDVFAAVLPGAVQSHRRLIRYRILAQDGAGEGIRVPYPDDPQPNFAYFVYDGVPAWHGAVQPGQTPVVEYGPEVMQSLPVYHLISKNDSVEHATWIDRYMGGDYKWKGTLVYDGDVYDHVSYRMRGGVWRYAMGKNMWKFDFNRGHDFMAEDNFGRDYDIGWTKLNLGACIQQGDYGHRGEQGMFEAVGFRLFNMAGVEAPHTHWAQFRVVDEAEEAHPDNQYEGDFWGLYLVTEQPDGRFLEEHDLPDGNFYKMEGGSGELNNLSPTGPTDKSDLNTFLNNYTGATTEWWRLNFDLDRYYSYQTIVQAIHHYDISNDKNFFYFNNPVTGKWQEHPWDLDLTWADNMYRDGGGVDRIAERLFQAPISGDFITLPGARPEIIVEFRNRVREVLDLLFNKDQAYQLIDEYGAIIHDPQGGPSMVGADRAMWDYNPIMSSSYVNPGKAGTGRFYQFPYEPGVSNSFLGTVELMKDYVDKRVRLLSGLAGMDSLIPEMPRITSLAPSNYPVNELVFECTDFNDDSGGFAAMEWRLGEVTPPGPPYYDPEHPRKYEINAVWESGLITEFTNRIQMPPAAAEVGHTYRARVRMQDDTGRWSHWSPPVEFVAGEPSSAYMLTNYLVLSELMYHPPLSEEHEFVELYNTSDEYELDIGGAAFTDGIDFTFAPGTVIPPGGYLLIINHTNVSAFREEYGLSNDVPVAGPFDGNLANDGERIELRVARGGQVIFSFEYNDERGWPLSADGEGHSMVPLASAFDFAEGHGLNYPVYWRASAYLGGSPGAADPELPRTLVINEVASNTEFNDPQRPNYNSNDWIELLNTSSNEVDLTGWYLSDDPGALDKFALGDITVPAGGRVCFDEVSGFNNPAGTGFAVDKEGELVLLSYLPNDDRGRIADAMDAPGLESETTWGRYPDGAEALGVCIPTRDEVNQPKPPPVVITEFMYHPPVLIGQTNESGDEYIEIFNTTTSEIDLSDTNHAWRLSGGIDFLFPEGSILAPSNRALVVDFDPADTVAKQRFLQFYGIEGAVTIFGPYSGNLRNSSERVTLSRLQPEPNASGPGWWAVIDEVIYADIAPWPASADGEGDALSRIDVGGLGSDPGNWCAAAPTPGDPGLEDNDGDGMPDAWEEQHGFDPDDPSDAETDADNDGRTNLQEYRDGTDPHDPQSYIIPPEIVSEPEDAMIIEGETLRLVIEVTGTAPLSFTWLHEGEQMPGATNAALVLEDIKVDDAGVYKALVSNKAGTAESREISVAVLEPPRILSQPLDLMIRPGDKAEFNVSAAGTEPLSYQWLFDGVEIDGATNSTLIIQGASTNQSGEYWVEVSNEAGSNSSAHAVLDVNPALVLPYPWENRDIGDVTFEGGVIYSNGVFFLEASGRDIWGSSDAFHFVYRPLNGDGTITARVMSVSNTDSWTKAGVMVRDTLGPQSAHAMTIITPGNGVCLQGRETEGGGTFNVPGSASVAPRWVRLERAGDVLTGYESVDGEEWSEIGSRTIPMDDEVYIGLELTAHNDSTIASGQIDNVTVESDDTPIEPPMLSIGDTDKDGLWELTLGEWAGGAALILEVSEDLEAWTPVWTNQSGGGEFIFEIDDASEPSAFYRLKLE